MLCCAVWSELEGTSRAAWQKTLDDVGRKLRGKFAERMPVKPGQKTLAHIEKCHFILKDQQVSKKKKKSPVFCLCHFWPSNGTCLKVTSLCRSCFSNAASRACWTLQSMACRKEPGTQSLHCTRGTGTGTHETGQWATCAMNVLNPLSGTSWKYLWVLSCEQKNKTVVL